ncbi:MAG: hypothetical protein ABSF24_11965 [Candidatus Bathyarchaeia archaeon]|jgi:hypothetical protein
MSEPEVNEKQVVGKNVVIVLGTISIVLIAWLAGTVVLMNFQITNLRGQVDDLSKIVNFEKTEIWLNNKTLSFGPNGNFTGWFNPSFPGNVEIVCNVQPPNPNIWVNLTWYVFYDPSHYYQDYPAPYIFDKYPNYSDMIFPIMSFGQPNYHEVGITIGNSDPALTSIVNFTASFTY